MVRKKKNTPKKKNRTDDSSDEDDSSVQSMPGLQERAREDSSSDGSSSSDDDSEVLPVSNNNNNNNNRRNGGGRRPAVNNNNNDSSSSDDDDSSATDADIPPLSNRYNATGDSSSDSDLSDRGMPDLVGRARNDDSESDDASRSGSDDDDNNNNNNNTNAPRARATRRRNNHGAARNSSSNNTVPTAPHVNNGDDNDSDSSAIPPDLIRRENNDDTSSDDSSDSNDDNNSNNNETFRASRKAAKIARKEAAFADAIADTNTTKKNKSKRQRKEEKKRLAKEAKKVEERKKKEAREKLAREKEKAARKEKKEYDCSTKIVAFYRQSIQQQKYNKLRYGFIRIQSLVRGKQSRKDNSNIIQHLKEFVLFYSLWGNCIQLSKSVEKDEPDWSSLREKQAYIRQQELMRDDEEDMKETDEKLTNSMADAMRTIEGKAAKLEDDIEEVHLPMKRVKIRNGHNGNSNGSNNNTDVLLNFSRIHFSGDVVKWVRNGDPKYVGLFVKRMKSLSGGERSRILAKRLNGSTTNKVPIYETYLEQKSGYRILWTEKDDYLLVWYVANHDKVSRLMRLIDDSKSRSQRQRVSINDMDEMRDACHNNANTKDEDEIFLDPLGNVPLKVYDISINDIEDIKKRDWTPALHLTEEERKVVETEGTVLLLGRSGTGKTICICNRMEYDRQQFKSDPLFSQLFVARSPRLCTYVKNNIGESDGSEFVTFEMLLEELENTLPKVDNIRDSFPENQFMRFSAFKQEIYDGDKGIDALVVWTNIRSFLKGSIEALKDSNLAVSEEEYISEENFGKKRCRLPTDQRKVVYEIFLEYQKRMSETNAWDNCDRIIALVQRLQAAKVSDPEMFEGAKIWCKWSKIYVDEVSNIFCFSFFFL